MQRVDAVQKDAGGPGAGEGGGDFLGDVAGFADADDHNFAALAERFDDDVDRRREVCIKLLPDGLERRPFNVEHFACPPEMIHARRVPAATPLFNIDFCPARIIVTQRVLRMKMVLHGVLVCCWLAAAPVFAQDLAPEQKLAEAYNALGFKLVRQIRDDNPAKTVFISPIGLAFALSMAADGAAGKTLSEMTATLQLKSGGPDLDNANKSLVEALARVNDKVKLEIANSLWAANNIQIKPRYLDATGRFYRAQAANVDFRSPTAAKMINDWVSEHTHGKIPKMVEPPLNANRIILLDAIYFKGDWLAQFDKKLTHDASFTLADGHAVTHPRMSRTGEFEYYENDAFQGVCLPYVARGVSMYVLLPSKGLGNLVSNLTTETWPRWIKHFASRKGTLELPRFKLENEYDLKPPLLAMGMRLAFSDHADFSRLSDEPLYIDWIRQKTYVDVNEEGTEAAAVTGIGFRAMVVMREPPPFRMIVDRPFLIVIRDNQTGAILFIGAIMDPRS